MINIIQQKCYNHHDCDSCFDYEECPMCHGADHAYKYTLKAHQMGLVAGRHDIPQAKEGYIYPCIPNKDATNMELLFTRALAVLLSKKIEALELYVTGMGTALCATLEACHVANIPVRTMHWDKEKGEYIPFNMF